MHLFRPGSQRRRLGIVRTEFHRYVHGGSLEERQRLPHLRGQVVLVRDLSGERRIGSREHRRRTVLSRLQRPGIHATAPQVGHRHALRRESGDRCADEHADRLHAGRVELHVGLGADVHAGGLRRTTALEAVMALGVVEHRGPLDAGHRADDKRQFFLRRHPQQLALHRPALPRAVFLEGTAEAAAKLPRQRLGVDQRPHVGALPAAWHPDPAAVGAMVGELGPIEGRLHDRHLGRRECHAGEQFDLFTRWPVAQEPASPADRRGNESQRDDLGRRDGQRQAVAGRWRGLLCVHALPFVTGELKRLEKKRMRCVSTRRNDRHGARWRAGGRQAASRWACRRGSLNVMATPPSGQLADHSVPSIRAVAARTAASARPAPSGVSPDACRSLRA